MSRISAMPELTAPAGDDEVEVRDKSDTSQAATGTNKRMTWLTTITKMFASRFAQDSGSTDTYVATLDPVPAAYVVGEHYRFKANTANTGACTINFNSLGAKTIKKHRDQDLADNDIEAGQWVDLVYDGTNMQMQSQLGNAPAAGLSTEDVQDIVGAMSTDSTSIDFTYDDGAATLTAAVKDGAPPLSPATVTLTDGATITWATEGARQNNARVTLGGNRTLDITGEVDGATGLLIVIQDGTGGRTLTLPGGSKVINDGGGAVTLSTGAGDIDILTWYYDGTNFFWTIGVNYS